MMKKFTKRLEGKKNSQKGFTLVELVVVLVILAILAATMVPAMTGWIGKAKEKQVAIEARSAYLAVQTLASEGYAKSTPDRSDITLSNVKELAELEGNPTIVVYYKDNAADNKTKEYYTVVGLKYTDGDLSFDIGDVSGTGDILN